MVVSKYVTLNRHLRSIAAKCWDAIEAASYDENGYVQGIVSDYVQRDIRDLLHSWPADLENGLVKQMRQLVGQAGSKADTFREVVTELLPRIEDQVDAYFDSRPSGDLTSALPDLLHPAIFESSYSHYRGGRLRDAVLSAIVAVFDLLRARTGIDKDGAQLVAEALSLEQPRLIISTLDSESGRNEQKGFLQILQGAYLGIRNPKAHSLASDLDGVRAAQYLVFASVLARRVDEAISPTKAP